MPRVYSNKINSKDRQAMLAIAQGFAKDGYIQHAIAAYEVVVEAAPESKEADWAESALLRIAKIYSQDYLHHRIIERRARSQNRV